MRGLRKTLFVIAVVNVLIMTVLLVMIKKMEPKPVRLTLESIDMTASFPDKRYRPLKQKNWEGYRFNSGLRVLVKAVDPYPGMISSMLKSRFSNPEIQTPIDLYDQGSYILTKRSKGYTISVVFLKGQKLYWLDTVSNSTLSFKRDRMHALLSGMVLEGVRVSDKLVNDLSRIESDTSVLILQSVEQFILFFHIILIPVLALVYWIHALMTRPPMNLPSGIYGRGSRDIGFSLPGRFKKWSPVFLYRNGNVLELYRFRKKVLSINLDNLKSPPVRKGKLLIFEEAILRISDIDIQKFYLASYIRSD